MNEIKWPIVILTNYRTGSNTLGYALEEQYSAKYFEEPSQDSTRLIDFKQFYYSRSADKKYIIKFMIDQLDDLDIYRELLGTDCHKIRLTRTNELEQCVSYYVATKRQLWKQEIPQLDQPYTIDEELRTMTWTTHAIIENNKALRQIDLKFDEELVYEELDLLTGPRFFKTTPPKNIEEIRTAVQQVIADGNLGHYNSGWKIFKPCENSKAEEEYFRNGYSFDWFYHDGSGKIDNSITMFSTTETRPNLNVDFWTLPDLSPHKRLFIDNNPRMDITNGNDVLSLERNDITHPFQFTIVHKPNSELLYARTVITDDGLTRTTDFPSADKRFLNHLFTNAESQSDYWEQHLYNKRNNIAFSRSITSYQVDLPSLLCVRSPGDEFTLTLFLKLVQAVKNDANLLYLWSTIMDPAYTQLIDAGRTYEAKIRLMMYRYMKRDLIVLGVKDHLTTHALNFETEKPTVAQYLENMFTFYSDKKFIFFTSMENLEAYITNENVYIIPWGGDITNHEKEYKTLTPVMVKNLDSEKTFISLNRGGRVHRLLSIGLLHGLELQSHGIISCLFDFNKIESDKPLHFSPSQLPIEQLFVKGQGLLNQNTSLITDGKDTIYTEKENDNVGNFNTNLSEYYKNTFVEIISETSCFEKSFLITEKTLNCVYGCNFPIMISSKGAVAFLREMGLDMFDDIVDHSYDSIENPVERIYRAISDNTELLTNNHRTKKLWQESRSRFEQNVKFVKAGMYEFYTNRATTKFNQVLNDNIQNG